MSSYSASYEFLILRPQRSFLMFVTIFSAATLVFFFVVVSEKKSKQKSTVSNTEIFLRGT